LTVFSLRWRMPADCSKGEVQRRQRRGLQPLIVATYMCTHDQFVGRSWPQSSSRAVICCHSNLLCQILRCCLVAALEHQNGQSKLDSFRNSQPVKFLKQRSNAVVLATAVDQSRCGIEHWLNGTLSLGDRAFAVAGPCAWNSLPEFVTDCSSPLTFKKCLKTYLFSSSF